MLKCEHGHVSVHLYEYCVYEWEHVSIFSSADVSTEAGVIVRACENECESECV